MGKIILPYTVSPQNFIEKITGQAFVFNTDNDFIQMWKILRKTKYPIKDYPLCELDKALSLEKYLVLIDGVISKDDTCINEVRAMGIPKECVKKFFN